MRLTENGKLKEASQEANRRVEDLLTQLATAKANDQNGQREVQNLTAEKEKLDGEKSKQASQHHQDATHPGILRNSEAD